MLEKEKQRVWQVAQNAVDGGLCIEGAGNFSLRDPVTKYVVMTPTQIPRCDLTPDMLVVMDVDGNIIEGPKEPTSEWPMHTMIYAAYPNVLGVVHTHAPYGTAFAVMNKEIPAIVNEGLGLGMPIPVAPWAIPGSAEMASTAIPLLKDRRAVMIKNHGTLTTGPTIEAAYKAMITLEDVARLYWLVLAAGAQAEVLTPEQIHKMRTTPKPKAKRV